MLLQYFNMRQLYRPIKTNYGYHIEQTKSTVIL